MNGRELALAIGIHPDTLSRLKKADPYFLRRFELQHAPETLQRRYSPELVARYKAGAPVLAFGQRGRKAS
jgi:hypothetical protein